MKDYYENAPKIVNMMNASEEGKRDLEKVFRTIEDAVCYIEKKNFAEALTCYKGIYEYLYSKYK